MDSKWALAARFDAVPGPCYLVRPDGYVLGRWKLADAQKIKDALGRVMSNREALVSQEPEAA
jgi:3-(3-hydroxy-phenyl)propionate hydroxylase